MLFTILPSALICLVIYFIFRLTLFPLLRVSRMKKRLQNEGTEAKAVLLNIEQAGFYINRQPQVKMQVQVQPATGRNFVSEIREALTLADLNQLRIGTTLKVKYNPANTKEIILLPKEFYHPEIIEVSSVSF